MQIDSHRRPDEATVRAYLGDQLRGARAEAFEAYCLGHPEFARRVETDLYLAQGLRHIAAERTSERAHPARRMILAVAAGLTLIVACGLFLLFRANPLPLTAYRSATDVPAALLSGPRVGLTLVSLRERTAEHRVLVPQGTGVLVLRVMPDSAPGPAGYAITVAPDTALMTRPVSVGRLQADNDGFVEVYLPVAAIVGRTLRVTVTPAPSPGTPALEFRLRVASSFSTSDETR